MAQAVSRRPLTAKARVRARIGPCGVCGGQSGSGTGFSTSSSVFSCQYHSTVAAHGLRMYHLGMNNRPVGGRGLETRFQPIDMSKRGKRPEKCVVRS
jgi:hypothetical protein